MNFVSDILELGPSKLDWYHLMRTADDWSEATGMGLASVWGLINRDQYDRAVERLRGIIEAHLELGPELNIHPKYVNKNLTALNAWRARNGMQFQPPAVSSSTED